MLRWDTPHYLPQFFLSWEVAGLDALSRRRRYAGRFPNRQLLLSRNDKNKWTDSDSTPVHSILKPQTTSEAGQSALAIRFSNSTVTWTSTSGSSLVPAVGRQLLNVSYPLKCLLGETYGSSCCAGRISIGDNVRQWC
jgi:hypothetical protein